MNGIRAIIAGVSKLLAAIPVKTWIPVVCVDALDVGLSVDVVLVNGTVVGD